MTLYRVTWEIDAEADTPREAAMKAREYQTKPGTTATVFRVYAPMYEPAELGGPSHLVATVDASGLVCPACEENFDRPRHRQRHRDHGPAVAMPRQRVLERSRRRPPTQAPGSIEDHLLVLRHSDTLEDPVILGAFASRQRAEQAIAEEMTEIEADREDCEIEEIGLVE